MKDDQRVSLTKRLLKEGLLRLMEYKPIEKIAVAELCAESGINRATFYRHYQLPKEVLLEIDHELIEGLRFETWEINNAQDIAYYSEFVLSYMEQHAAVLRILLQNHSDESLTHMINEFCDIIFRIKTKHKAVSALDAESTRLLSAYMVGGIYYLLREWLLGSIQKTPHEISELVLQFVEAGISLSVDSLTSEVSK